VTALAGGDPQAMSCLDITLPSLDAAGAAPGATAAPTPAG
jgi:hypothetical protein